MAGGINCIAHIISAAENFPEDFSMPVIISKSALAKMTIDESHPLFRQVYWINRK